ncbi:cancer-associated gene 1 protein [Pan troglodytes]|uniref:cancer-associated gene 1 protein n=1 Tax=Pan troglodytes TaxID=9598 RepID=UPI000292A8AF|nr:cancer-associated gene 1 protein [Pan troglodytes]
MNKDYKKFWSSPSDPVHFEVDTSHEKVESMSESDTMNISNLSQGVMLSHSPICMETTGTTCDLPQNEIKNFERENEYESTLCEDAYGTLDNLLNDNNVENYSTNALIQPVDTISISSLRQFETVCKFHWVEAFDDEMTEKPEFQSQVYNYAKDNNIKQDSFKEENPMETSVSANTDQLGNEYFRQPPPRSPPLIHCSGETLKFTEKSLAKSIAKESALNPSQPPSFLCKESTAVPSKEIQNYGEIPEMSVSYEKEVTAEGVERPEIVSTWSSAGISWRSEACRENCEMPDWEQSAESLQPVQEDMALNEVLQKLKHTNRKQEVRIQELQCSNLYLEKRVKELQMKITKQQVFIDVINKLKENVEELIEDKYKIILEKNDTKKTLQNLEEVLANTQKHLQESRNDKEMLQLQFKKIKANYVRLQERYMTEMRQKNKSVSQYLEMDKTLTKKEEEVERLQQLKKELEKATASALDLLKREKEAQEQEFLSLQEEFQKLEKENLEERQKLKSRLEKLLTQVRNLQFMSENERTKNIKLQQQINEVKNENAKLKQQVARSEEQNYVPKFETAQLKDQLEEVLKSDITKDTKTTHSNLLPDCSPCEEERLNPADIKRASQLASKMHSLLALMVGLLTCQDIINSDAEHFKESEKVSDIMLQKLKSLHLKKKTLDKELLKHKDRITIFRELIAKEKAFQDHAIKVIDCDSDEAKSIRDVPTLLGAKLDKYHSLNEELDFLITKLGHLLESKENHCNRLIEENDKYQRHLGNLIKKVTSYEEIIECADQRLAISHSQIAHLEERNKHLEDLIRKPREKARKPRSKSLENHPKSMTMMPALFKENRNDLD